MTSQYITNEKGEKIAVVIPIKKFEKMMEDLDDLEDIKAYDRAMIAAEPSIPIEKAFKELDKKRKKKK